MSKRSKRKMMSKQASAIIRKERESRSNRDHRSKTQEYISWVEKQFDLMCVENDATLATASSMTDDDFDDGNPVYHGLLKRMQNTRECMVQIDRRDQRIFQEFDKQIPRFHAVSAYKNRLVHDFSNISPDAVRESIATSERFKVFLDLLQVHPVPFVPSVGRPQMGDSIYDAPAAVLPLLTDEALIKKLPKRLLPEEDIEELGNSMHVLAFEPDRTPTVCRYHVEYRETDDGVVIHALTVLGLKP